MPVRVAGFAQRDAWLQKHPSPVASRGEFHWYPEGADRELRAEFVERLRGVEPPAVLWQLAPGRVAWGQAFAATSPADGRRYVGLVLSVIEGDAPVDALLARLMPPAPVPWTEAGSDPRPTVARLRGDVAGVVRALISGGAASVADPESPGLPAWIASIERMLPATDRSRAGVLAIGELADEDRVAALAAAAWRDPASRAATAWTLLCELAAARGASIDEVGASLASIDVAAALTAAERGALASEPRVLDALHAWGRGRFDRSPEATSLPGRLADLVALRVLARLAADHDAADAIAEARWYALLPAIRRTSLLAAVAGKTASLRALVEANLSNPARDRHA